MSTTYYLVCVAHSECCHCMTRGAGSLGLHRDDTPPLFAFLFWHRECVLSVKSEHDFVDEWTEWEVENLEEMEGRAERRNGDL